MRNQAINNAIAISLSRDRLNKYLIASGSDLDLAISLYERNTRLAEAFYTPLQALEISFRNHINDAMMGAYGEDWLSSGVVPLRPHSLKSIGAAEQSLKQANAPISQPALVAELSFGFWVALLGPRYDASIWRQACYRAFRLPNGKRLSRSVVHGRANALRRFRNRVAHHEPIFANDLKEVHEEAMEAIGWMCGMTEQWARHHSRFIEVHDAV